MAIQWRAAVRWGSQVRRISNDVVEFRTLVKEIAGLEVEDGVVFDLTSVSAIAIRDADE